MSPNEQRIASGRNAISIALSIYSTGVTQTGQPGPCTSVISLGSSSSMPNRTMAWVWPPQTSIKVQGRVTVRGDRRGEAPRGGGVAIFVAELHGAPARSASSPISRKVVEHARGLRLVDHGDGEADMDKHVVADPRLGREGEIDLLDDAAEIDPPGSQDRIVAGEVEDMPGDR